MSVAEIMSEAGGFFGKVLGKLNLKNSAGPHAVKQEPENPLDYIQPECITLDLQGDTKEAVITELVDLLYTRGKVTDPALAVSDVLRREQTMSTGMQHGIALPHAKTDAVKNLAVAVGVKKSGLDFESIDGEKSRLFIMVLSSKKVSGPHVQFLSAVGAVLRDEAAREAVINARSPEDAAELLRVR